MELYNSSKYMRYLIHLFHDWPLVDLEVEFPSSQETETIVSTKAVTEIQRLLREEGEVKLSIGENQIAFELNRILLVSKLIEGNYPNYRQVIPSEAKERITLERETFLTAVRRVSLLASEKSVKLIFSKSNIDIVANTLEVGEAQGIIAGEDVSFRSRLILSF